MPAEIALRSHPSTALTGKVVRVEPVSDSVTEERIAFVAFDSIPPGSTLGELAEVTVKPPPREAALTVPNAAVKHMVRGTGVWVVQDERPAFAKVTLGENSLDGRVQVLDGLHAGDAVVVHGEKELADGARITVVERLAGSQP